MHQMPLTVHGSTLNLVRSFRYLVSTVWKRLPLDKRLFSIIDTFKRCLQILTFHIVHVSSASGDTWNLMTAAV